MRKLRVCVLLAVILVLALPTSAGATPGPYPELDVIGGLLAVPRALVDESGRDFRAEIGEFLGVMNGHHDFWSIDESSRLIIDLGKLQVIIAEEDLARHIDVQRVLLMATRYNGRHLTIRQSTKFGIRALTPYYDDVLVSSGDYYTSDTYVETDWLRGPGTVGFSRGWTYNWTWSSGGGNGSSSMYISWLNCDPSFSVSESGTYSWPVPAGQDGRGMREDRYYHTWATYDEWYYYENPDIPGQWQCSYVGRFTATSRKFYDRTYYCEYRPSP